MYTSIIWNQLCTFNLFNSGMFHWTNYFKINIFFHGFWKWILRVIIGFLKIQKKKKTLKLIFISYRILIEKGREREKKKRLEKRLTWYFCIYVILYIRINLFFYIILIFKLTNYVKCNFLNHRDKVKKWPNYNYDNSPILINLG
jgi:hypothetical protein